MLVSHTPFNAIQQVIKTYKEAFKNISRISIFVMNRYLQAYVFKGMHNNTKVMSKTI